MKSLYGKKISDKVFTQVEEVGWKLMFLLIWRISEQHQTLSVCLLMEIESFYSFLIASTVFLIINEHHDILFICL